MNIVYPAAVLFGLMVAISLVVTEWSEHSMAENWIAIGIIVCIIILFSMSLRAISRKAKGKEVIK